MASLDKTSAQTSVHPGLVEGSSIDALAIAGPTASGKTSLAFEIAKCYDVEIISVDSALVYRGMNIGTAKPTALELAQVPHHLIDILDANQSYSAAEFARTATDLIANIQSRGKLPLLVGGTMLYFKALVQGMDDMPAAAPEIRAAIDAQAAKLGWTAMHTELQKFDPITAARISPNDSQRIQRAIEIYRATGLPLSHFQKKSLVATAEHAQAAPKNRANGLRIPIISLEPNNRAWLHERIAQRFDAMLSAGLIDEVRALKTRADLHLNLPSMRCVGYRQVWEMLDGVFPPSELRERGIAATRQLAKRQITWLRSMNTPAFEKHIVAAEAVCTAQKALDLIANNESFALLKILR